MGAEVVGMTNEEQILALLLGMNTRLEHIETNVQEIHVRLDRIEERLDRVEERLDRVEERLDDLEQGQIEVRDTVDAIVEWISKAAQANGFPLPDILPA